MQDFFGQLGKGFLQYWNEIKTADLSYWFWLPGILLAAWLVSFGFRFIMAKNKFPYKTIFTIHRRIAAGAAVTGFIFALLMIYWWATKFYDRHPLAFIHLLCLFLLLLLPIINLLVLRRYYKREALREITSQPKTEIQQITFADTARKSFAILKRWGILVAAGGLLGTAIWGLKSDKNLVSIVIDNSSSMDQALINGKQALTNTFTMLNKNTNIIITSFKNEPAAQKKTVDDVLRINKYGNVSVTQFFENPGDAINAINGISAEGGSPILQNIWENYLFVKQTRDIKQYKNTCLLVITDGIDNLNESIANNPKFLCQSPEFNEIFPSENFHFIDVEGNYEFDSAVIQRIALFDKAVKCGYDIQNGKSLDDYILATEDALKDFKKDWRLPIWMGIIYLIYVLTILFINTGNKL
jgi:hypothetical protein